MVRYWESTLAKRWLHAGGGAEQGRSQAAPQQWHPFFFTWDASIRRWARRPRHGGWRGTRGAPHGALQSESTSARSGGGERRRRWSAGGGGRAALREQRRENSTLILHVLTCVPLAVRHGLRHLLWAEAGVHACVHALGQAAQHWHRIGPQGLGGSASETAESASRHVPHGFTVLHNLGQPLIRTKL